MRKTKIICLYQVIMHYRIPFYERLSNDNDFTFKLLYGRGKRGSKLVNSKVNLEKINKEELYDVRTPLPFTPCLFFKLVSENPSIIFSEGSSSLINSSIAFIYSKIFRKKFIWWSLGMLQNKKYSGFRKLINYWELFIEKHSDAIFTYSSRGAKYFLERGIDFAKIYTAVNVIDTSKKQIEISQTFEKGYLDQTKFNIGFIGTIQKTKNLKLLIDVVNGLNEKYHDLKLNLVGDGEYLNELLKYDGINEAIVFHGRINYGSSRILGNCDVFVLPGLGGLAICEGMLNKLPIITGNADGTEYDLVDETNGYVLEDINYNSLFEKIEYLYLNRDIAYRMGQNSYNKITNKLSFDNYYNVFKKIIYDFDTN